MYKSRRKQWSLIILCWALYTLAYVARYGYSANITLIISEFGASKSDAGIVSSFFFFSYGIGQVVNGILCRRYDKKTVLACALLLSFACNLLIFIGIPFALYKLVWALNGIAQSFFWTSIILTLGENLDDEMLPRATFLMSSTAPIGILIVYGLSALYSALGVYQLIFLTGALGMLIMAVVWYIIFPRLATERKKAVAVKETKDKRKLSTGVIVTVIMLAVFAIINNFVKDGLTGWSPDVLKSDYGFDDSIAILITLVLPVVGCVFQALNVAVQKKIKNFTLLSGVWFLFSGIFLTASVALLSVKASWVMLVICMALTCGCMYNVNNIVTSMAPLYMRASVSSGLMAGIMDGFCYMGSTIGMVLLGATSDGLGWTGAFVMLAILSFAPVVISVIYLISTKLTKKEKTMENEIKAIVFDLDGTLLNTLDDLHASVNYTLEKFGYPLRTKDQVRAVLGKGVRYTVEMSLPESARDKTDECLSVFKEYYEIHKNDNTAPYDGIIEMLKKVKQAGYKTAIVSNKYDGAVQQLKEITFTGLIDFALGEGNGIPTKPNPDGVWLALEKLGASKEESVYVGDSEVDLLTARNSGLRCIAVTWGFRDRSQLVDEGALNIIDTPDEFLPLISGKIY